MKLYSTEYIVQRYISSIFQNYMKIIYLEILGNHVLKSFLIQTQ